MSKATTLTINLVREGKLSVDEALVILEELVPAAGITRMTKPKRRPIEYSVPDYLLLNDRKFDIFNPLWEGVQYV
ncbi:MAG: hypothetical protein AB1746_09755 [Candidatus Zixiibacteriota bacterium]